VYAVNGTGKPYYDHDLGRVEGDRHAFKQRFMLRLLQECLALQSQGLALVLIGDWNISRTKLDTVPRLRSEEPHAGARKLFNEHFIPALGVVDVFRELHPDERSFTWFNRLAAPGTLDAARVDFALVSESVLDRVEDASIDPLEANRFGSDHAPIYVKLKSRSA
jgi:exodeoxyribonuclease-3